MSTLLRQFPQAQAVYVFGSWGTADEWPSSDVDIAVLLPPDVAKKTSFFMHPVHAELERLLGKDVDLLNLRRASTVFQMQVVKADRRIYTGDEYAAEEFEMLTFSFYQKMNEERAEIMAEFMRTGKAYKV